MLRKTTKLYTEIISKESLMKKICVLLLILVLVQPNIVHSDILLKSSNDVEKLKQLDCSELVEEPIVTEKNLTPVTIDINRSIGDTYEPNETMKTAYGPIYNEQEYSSYIFSSDDTDYYYFETNETGYISITLSNLPDDYDLYLYDSAGAQIGASTMGLIKSEAISIPITYTGKFYIKVIGYGGVYSTDQAYKLSVNYPKSFRWYYEDLSIHSPHNYPNNYNEIYEYRKMGAQKVGVYFDYISTQAGHDYVYILNRYWVEEACYDGGTGGFWAIVDNDSILVNLVSDSSITEYGYHISKVGYYSDGPITIEDVDIDYEYDPDI